MYRNKGDVPFMMICRVPKEFEQTGVDLIRFKISPDLVLANSYIIPGYHWHGGNSARGDLWNIR